MTRRFLIAVLALQIAAPAANCFARNFGEREFDGWSMAGTLTMVTGGILAFQNNAVLKGVGLSSFGGGSALTLFALTATCMAMDCKVAKQDAAEFLAQVDAADPSPALAELIEKVREEIQKTHGLKAADGVTDQAIAEALVATQN